MAEDNTELGRVKLVNLPIKPAGVPKINVKFDIDRNGVLTVTASTNNDYNTAQVAV